MWSEALDRAVRDPWGPLHDRSLTNYWQTSLFWAATEAYEPLAIWSQNLKIHFYIDCTFNPVKIVDISIRGTHFLLQYHKTKARIWEMCWQVNDWHSETAWQLVKCCHCVILLTSVIASPCAPPHYTEWVSFSHSFTLLSSVNHLITSNLCMASIYHRRLYTQLLFVSWPDYLTVFLSWTV